MANRANWVPDDINEDVPSAARVYDYLLGGAHNFAADRAVGNRIFQILPNARQVAASNRAFLSRAVRYMVNAGITQFLDLGSGIPTVGNVHDVAQQANPDCKVVYVDYDPIAVAHSELILEGNQNCLVIDADLCEPDRVLGNRKIQDFLDFSQPVGLLMVAIFHFVPDELQPKALVRRYVDAMPAGSLVALSHLTADQFPGEMAAVVDAMRNSRDPMFFRPYGEVVELFEGLHVVEPGVVDAPRWHADVDSDRMQEGVYVGLARKA